MDDSTSSSSLSPATSAAGWTNETSSPSVIFVPPPLPAFLTAPCRPGFQTCTSTRHPVTDPGLPPPRPKFRRFAWSKIPASRVLGRNNVWTSSDRLFHEFQLDFERIEELFSVVVSSSASTTAPASPSASTGVKYPTTLCTGGAAGSQESTSRSSSSTLKPHKQSSEINLLDSRRSLNVNVFLRQFRMKSYSDLVQMLARGDSELLGAEKLRCLQRILPLDSERQMLASFDGDVSCLGNAEKFCLGLMKLSNCDGRVEVMLFKEEFKQSNEKLNSAINAVVATAQQLKTNTAFHQVLHMLLQAGNFLNTGGLSGDAAGFRLNSLLNLAELRANKPRMTLLHYVTMEAEEKNPDVLKFPDQLESLKEAVECPVETLRSEISSLSDQLKSVSRRLYSIDAIFRNKFTLFLQEAERGLHKLESNMKQVETLRVELAAYYCEDETFQLDDAFKIVRAFCDKLQKASKENRERRIQEQKSEERRKLLEEKLNPLDESRRRLGSMSSVAGDYDSENDLEGALLFGTHGSRSTRRSRTRLARSHSVCDTTTAGHGPDAEQKQSTASGNDPCRGDDGGRASQQPLRRPTTARRFRLTSAFDDGCCGRERVSGSGRSVAQDVASAPRTCSNSSDQTQTARVHDRLRNVEKPSDKSSSRNIRNSSQQPRQLSSSISRVDLDNGKVSNSSSLDHTKWNYDTKLKTKGEKDGDTRVVSYTKSKDTNMVGANSINHSSSSSSNHEGVRSAKNKQQSRPAALSVRRTSLDMKSQEDERPSTGRISAAQRLRHRDGGRAGLSQSGTMSANSSPRLMRSRQQPPTGSNAVRQRDNSTRLSQPKSTPTASRRSSVTSVGGPDDVSTERVALTTSKLNSKLSRVNWQPKNINGSVATSDHADSAARDWAQALAKESNCRSVTITKLSQHKTQQMTPDNATKTQTVKNEKVQPSLNNNKIPSTISRRSPMLSKPKQTAGNQSTVKSRPALNNNEVTISRHKPIQQQQGSHHTGRHNKPTTSASQDLHD